MEKETFTSLEPADTHVAGGTDRFANISFNGWRSAPVMGSGKNPSHRVRPDLPAAAPGRVEVFDEGEVEFVREVISRAGLDLAHYRLAPLLRRIPACLRVLRVDTIPAARTAFRQREDLLPLALNSLLIGTTEFFRDTAVFGELKQRVIPELQQLGRPPRVWSVACSDGVELYSIGMLLQQNGTLAGGDLLGTDCRTAAIERAARGIYPATCLGQIPPEHRRNFSALGRSHVQVCGEIRAATRWQAADAMLPPAETGWDLILCRNFTIYLGTEAAGHLWSRLSGALNPGGFLVVGKAEKPKISELRREGHSVYRKLPSSSGC